MHGSEGGGTELNRSFLPLSVKALRGAVGSLGGFARMQFSLTTGFGKGKLYCDVDNERP